MMWAWCSQPGSLWACVYVRKSHKIWHNSIWLAGSVQAKAGSIGKGLRKVEGGFKFRVRSRTVWGELKNNREKARKIGTAINGDGSFGAERELQGRNEGYQEHSGYRDTELQRWWGEGGTACQGRAEGTLINATSFKEHEVTSAAAH